VQNRPLLDWLVAYLCSGGAEEVIVNTYHLSEKLIEYIERSDFPIPVHLRVEKTLLGTGGGIRNVTDFWDQRPLVVINGDIFSAIDLQAVLRSHEDSGAAVFTCWSAGCSLGFRLAPPRPSLIVTSNSLPGEKK
jgi:mannose-1-phosphate guanylyltransferase